MKGIKLIAFLGLAIIFLTGCGNGGSDSNANTLTCTNTTENDSIERKEDIVMTFDNDKITKIKLSVDSKVKDEVAKENWDLFVAMMESQFVETKEDGFTLTTDNDKDNYIFKVTLDVDPTIAKEDVFSTYGLASLGDFNSTYDEIIAAGEEAGFTCK